MSELGVMTPGDSLTMDDSSPKDFGDSQIIKSHEAGQESLPAANIHLCSNEIEKLETEFSKRYTDADPEYIKTTEAAVAWSKPPCVQDFFVRRPRDDSRNWNRHRGGGDRGNRHGGYHNNRGRHWGGGDNRYRGYNQRDSYDRGSRDRGYRRERSPHR